MRKTSLICLALSASTLCLWGASCSGQIEAQPPLDEEGEPIPIPQPYEPWLLVREVAPQASGEQTRLALRPTIAVTFNQYLEDESFRSYGVARMGSGGIGASGSTEYRMTTKRIIWRARADLREDFEYTFTLGLENLRSVTASPPLPGATLSRVYIAASAEDEGESWEDALSDEPVSWGEVEQLFEQRGCYSCHGQPRWSKLGALTPEALVGIKSSQRDLQLVRPGDPTDSYLMHKLLPDYPVREGTVQPPPWGEGETQVLTREELWLVERWIRAGARP